MRVIKIQWIVKGFVVTGAEPGDYFLFLVQIMYMNYQRKRYNNHSRWFKSNVRDWIFIHIFIWIFVGVLNGWHHSGQINVLIPTFQSDTIRLYTLIKRTSEANIPAELAQGGFWWNGISSQTQITDVATKWAADKGR